MTTRPLAVLCDVYKTLIEVSAPPPDAEERWVALSRPLGITESLEEVGALCGRLVWNEHEHASKFGILHPEVSWDWIMLIALPALQSVPDDALHDFIFQHSQLLRTIRLMPGAAEFLSKCREEGIVLGIASNAQAYTLRELDTVLQGTGVSRADFAADLTFWSFENGFSKPDPHVYRQLGSRLGLRTISCAATLMVGDRLDNDIHPAAAQGFRTWHFRDTPERNWAAVQKTVFSPGALRLVSQRIP